MFRITNSIERQTGQVSRHSNRPRTGKRGKDNDHGQCVLRPVEAGGKKPSTVVDQLWHDTGHGDCVRRGSCQHLLQPTDARYHGSCLPGPGSSDRVRANSNPARLRRRPFVAGAVGRPLERRRLILIQFAALALSLAAAALAPDAWSLVVASVFVGVTSSVAQQIVPFAADRRTQSPRCDHRNRDERPPLRHPIRPRPCRRCWRPPWLARHVLARLAPGGCGGPVAGGGPAQKPDHDAGGLRHAPQISGRPLAGRAGIATGDHHSGLSVRLISVLWTILALQLDARYHLSAEIAACSALSAQ